MIRHAPSIGLGLGLSLRGSGGSGGVGFRGLLDQYGGAAAAYSLRALSSGWLAGDVVEVRPSSGWTPASFTANQVANGEMVDYVKRCGDFTNDGYETFANNGTGDGFTATNTSGTGFARSSSVFGTTSDVVTIDFDLSIVSGSPSISLRAANTQRSNLITFTTSGSKSAVLTATGGFDNFTFSEGDVPANWTISNVRVSANDGFVSTWYDQSGFANDATQGTTTAQPKIVSAGSLVTGGLDFDGVDDRFTSALAHSADISAFLTSTINQDNTSNSERIVYLADGSDSFQITRASASESFELSSKNTAFQATTAAFRHGVSPIGLNLVTMITSSSATSAFSDGASTTNSAQALGAGGNATTTIGARDDLLASSFFKGQMDEIIIYNSDQTANRAAIEANINDAYSIY